MTDIIPKEQQADLVAMANLLAKSKMVPDHFRNSPADCAFAADLSRSLGLPTIEVMRALYPSKGGKWGWSTEFMVAQLVRSGRIKGTLLYEESGEGKAFKVRCRAIDAETGETVMGPWITWKIVEAEGWARNAKYQSVPEHMMSLRAATWFIRRQYPDVLMGHRPADELEDIEFSRSEERKELQAAAEDRYSPKTVEAEVVEKFEQCLVCAGHGEIDDPKSTTGKRECTSCDGAGEVPA